jgi:nitroreductase
LDGRYSEQQEKGGMAMNEVIRAIKSRRSVRAYKSDLLKREVVEAIVEAGYYAPTGHNEQPWHFSVIQDRVVIEGINAKCKELMANVKVDWIKNLAENPKSDITYHAPLLILVSGKKAAMTEKADCTVAMQNMLLAAESLGVGSCWMGLVNFIFTSEDEMEKLGVPEGYEPLHAAVFGYKADGTPKAAPLRNRDVVTYIGTFE